MNVAPVSIKLGAGVDKCLFQVVFRLAIVAAVLSGLWTACYLAIAIIAFLASDKDDDNILMGIM